MFTCKYIFHSHDPICSVDICENVLICSYYNGTIVLWDLTYILLSDAILIREIKCEKEINHMICINNNIVVPSTTAATGTTTGVVVKNKTIDGIDETAFSFAMVKQPAMPVANMFKIHITYNN